jgi:hypothetical protein
MAARELLDQTARTTALTKIDRSFLVEASAGSGKTSIMAGRVAFLFAEGKDPMRPTRRPVLEPLRPAPALSGRGLAGAVDDRLAVKGAGAARGVGVA